MNWWIIIVIVLALWNLRLILIHQDDHHQIIWVLLNQIRTLHITQNHFEQQPRTATERHENVNETWIGMDTNWVPAWAYPVLSSRWLFENGRSRRLWLIQELQICKTQKVSVQTSAFRPTSHLLGTARTRSLLPTPIWSITLRRGCLAAGISRVYF